MSARDTDPLVYRFFTEVGIIEQLVRNKLEQELPEGITMAQFTVLQHFARQGGEKTPLNLARAMQVTKGTMTNTIQRLEAQELIKIRPDPSDGRGKLVSLTLKGRNLRDHAVDQLAPELKRFAIAFGESSIEDALPFLQKVRTFLDEDRN